jgi:hypothetical protein
LMVAMAAMLPGVGAVHHLEKSAVAGRGGQW